MPDKEQFVKRDVIEPYAVQLAGEYDIWDRRNPDAEVFQFGLRSRELTADDWKWLLTVRDADQQGEYELAKTHLAVDTLLSAGHLIRRYQQGVDAETIKRGFTATFEGLTFLVLNTARCNSLTFTEGLRPEHEALMGFYNDGKQWAVTLYHAPGHEQHDLSKIAVKYGGGRHRGACGFRAEVLPFVGEK